MASVQSPRAFLTFPSEIRNQIYEYLLCNTYIVFGEKPRLVNRLFEAPPSPANLAILRTSRTIKYEAEEVFYRCGTFCYLIEGGDRSSTPSTLQHSRMRKLYIIIDTKTWEHLHAGFGCSIEERRRIENRAAEIVDKTLKIFTGTQSLTRRSCKIKFWSCEKYEIHYWTKEFWQAMAQMVGFKKMEIVIESTYHSQQKWLEYMRDDNFHNDLKDVDPIPCATLDRYCLASESRLRVEDYTDALRHVRKKLEYTLGPSNEIDTPGAVNCAYSKTLVFKPRKHEVETLRAEAERLEAEVKSRRIEAKTLRAEAKWVEELLEDSHEANEIEKWRDDQGSIFDRWASDSSWSRWW